MCACVHACVCVFAHMLVCMHAYVHAIPFVLVILMSWTIKESYTLFFPDKTLTCTTSEYNTV